MAKPWAIDDHDAVAQLVRLYRENEVLWNTTHKLYGNRHARGLAVRSIVAGMGADWTERRVRHKITTIRASYGRERRKRDNLKSEPGLEETFVSTWWLFEPLDEFLAPHSKSNRIKNNMSATLLPPEEDELLDGVDSDITVDDAEDTPFSDEDEPTSQGDVDRLMRQVHSRSASLGNQSCSEVASRPTLPGPDHSQAYDLPRTDVVRGVHNRTVSLGSQSCSAAASRSTLPGPDHDQPHDMPLTDVVRGGSSEGSRKRQNGTAGNPPESVVKCAATVEQLGDKVPGGCRAHDDCDDFATFVGSYLRRITNPDIRDEAMFEIHKILRESVRKQRSMMPTYL